MRWAVPEAGDRAERDREGEQERKCTRIECGPEPAKGGRREPDGEHGQRRVRQCQHEDRGGERCGGPESESERRQVAVAALAVLKAEGE